MSAVFRFPESSSSSSTPALNQPQLALVLYAGERSFVLKHPLSANAKGQPVMGAGRGVSTGDRQALLQALGAQGLTPVQPNTLATSPVACAWWVPAGERALLFEPKYGQTATVSRLSGVPIPWPALVFIASAARLQVFALRENGRPTLETPLMHAPFWNLFQGGGVCRGSVQYPSACTPDLQGAWEAVFFQSVFTGPSRTDRYMNWGRSYEELLSHALKQEQFPLDVLMPAGVTLQEALG